MIGKCICKANKCKMYVSLEEFGSELLTAECGIIQWTQYVSVKYMKGSLHVCKLWVFTPQCAENAKGYSHNTVE